jgi:hypothetical protein
MKLKQFLLIGTLTIAGLGLTYMTVFAIASYLKYKAVERSAQAVQNKVMDVLDADRTQVWLKDHCEKHPEHLRCVLIK